ncbi:MAG: hypothetical protein Q4A67_07080, partial [Aerococcus sp.]|nr:hypothetical protein [Aerococcus sp.]
MKRNNRKNLRVAVMAAVISVLIVGGSYAYGYQREMHYLAEEKAIYEGKKPVQQETTKNKESEPSSVASLSELAKAFEDQRDSATVVNYLAYIKQQGDQPTITTVKTMGGERDWVKEGLAKAIANTELKMDDINYQTLDAVRSNSSSMVEALSGDQLQKQKPQLVIIPFPNAADVRDGLATADSIENAIEAYQNVRLTVPAANVLFISQPAESDALNTQDTFTAGIEPFGKGLADKQYNWLNLATGEQRPDLTYGEDGLSDKTIDQLRDAFAQALKEQKWHFTLGYKGDNDSELDALKEASQSRSESRAAAQAEAASRAQAQAIEESRLAESKALESSILESQQQQQQASQNQESNQQSGNNKYGNNNYGDN